MGDLMPRGETHMPKIVRFDELGGPEVLKIEEETSKQPGKGEVRLRVQAVGLNRAEAMFVRGHYLEQPKLPAGIGYEAAGVVEAVGPDVDRSEEHTSELQSLRHLVCRLLLEKKKHRNDARICLPGSASALHDAVARSGQ